MNNGRPELKRGLSLPLVVLYGLGTTIGAGIYVLVGKVAGVSGLYTPLAFLLASMLAAFTAFSFAELSSRYPKSAGEALYVQEGLGSTRLAQAVGLLVVAAALVSSATITRGLTGYLAEFLILPKWAGIVMTTGFLGALAIWGITQSILFAALITLVEIFGLLLAIWAGSGSLAGLPERLPELVPLLEAGSWAGIFSGAFLAFYAFLGFEDMVNVAEEVKEAPATMPTAIIVTLVVTTVLYFALALVAVLSLPMEELTASEAPLALLYEKGTGGSSTVISLISIFAVVNGILIQIVMATRVLYGMVAQSIAPAWMPSSLGKVHPVTRTPVRATLLVTVLITILALSFPLVGLAEVTSLITLVIFSLINLALIRIKRREPAPEGAQVYPGWIPITGLVVSLFFLLLRIYQEFSPA